MAPTTKPTTALTTPPAPPGGSPHFHRLRVASVQPEGEDALVLGFELPAALAPLFRFQPGQYLTLRQAAVGVERANQTAGEQPPAQADVQADAQTADPLPGLRRAYSICAGPGEPLRVGIRRVPGGAFSGWVHQRVQPGTVLEVMPPQGRFGHLLAPGQRPLCQVLALAGGSGVTPILAIVKAVLAQAQGARVSLVYVNRSPASAMFLAELQDLKDRHMGRLALHCLYTREQGDGLQEAGRLDPVRLGQLLRLTGGASRVDAAFVCGPAGFNDEMEAALRQAGVPAARIQVERFGVPDVAPEAAREAAVDLQSKAQAVRNGAEREPVSVDVAPLSPVSRVTVLRDGRSHRFDFLPGDDNLLVAAARAGLDLPFSCRSGVCATCRARVMQGEVAMARNFALAEDELAAGFVLACQARPLGTDVHLSFDER